jgi:hypothetical protein
MRRALQLDVLASILPMERYDRLAEHLTDEDVATLKHLAQEGMGENTLRAPASDPAYLEAWALAATDKLPWPASESLAPKFVAHHLGTPAAQGRSAARHAGRRGVVTSGSRSATRRRTACAVNSQAPLGKLGHVASLERAGGSVRRAKPSVSAKAGCSRLEPAAPAQEHAGGYPRHP